jgi:hypothetical protein
LKVRGDGGRGTRVGGGNGDLDEAVTSLCVNLELWIGLYNREN